MACGLRHPSESWSSEDFAEPAPAPIDPALLTLAAAALTGLAPMAADMTEEWIASKAKRLALAMRAALREAEKGETP